MESRGLSHTKQTTKLTSALTQVNMCLLVVSFSFSFLFLSFISFSFLTKRLHQRACIHTSIRITHIAQRLSPIMQPLLRKTERERERERERVKKKSEYKILACKNIVCIFFITTLGAMDPAIRHVALIQYFSYYFIDLTAFSFHIMFLLWFLFKVPVTSHSLFCSFYLSSSYYIY